MCMYVYVNVEGRYSAFVSTRKQVREIDVRGFDTKSQCLGAKVESVKFERVSKTDEEKEKSNKQKQKQKHKARKREREKSESENSHRAPFPKDHQL